MTLEKTEREAAQDNIAENRKAFHDYHLLESFEAGIALLGTEVKAIREGRVNLRDSFARLEGGDLGPHDEALAVADAFDRRKNFRAQRPVLRLQVEKRDSH